MATHGSISEFCAEKENWKSYIERLQQYFTANDVDSTEKQRAILLSACGAPTYQLIKSLLAPKLWSASQRTTTRNRPSSSSDTILTLALESRESAWLIMSPH